MKFTDLEITILHHAEELVKSEFQINTNRFFHYTNLEAANKILASKIYQASFIRSSSDPLEFSAPMAACRDWVCLTSNFFQHSKFPTAMFKHFDEEASVPSARAYIISLSHNLNSEHLKSMYGDIFLEFKDNTKNTDFKKYGFFIKCKYVDDIKKEVFRLLERWKNEVLERSFAEHKIENAQAIMSTWFYTLMQFCNTISVGIKQKAYELEEESRIVVFPRFPDQASHWHEPRTLKSVSSVSLVQCEFLPLKLNGMGLIVDKR